LIKSFLILLICIPYLYAQDPRTEYSPYSDTIPQSRLSSSQADSIFNFIVSNKHLIDLDDCNICKSRAHIITRIIEKYFPKVTPAKVWLIADCMRVSTAKTITNTNLLHSFIHPVSAQTGHITLRRLSLPSSDTIVIDPSTQSGPVRLSKWAGDIIPTERQTGF
jgi:hypothetical protein